MTWKELGIGLLIFTILTIAAFGLASAVWAQTESVTVAIPPQDLSTALNTFAEQTGFQILYASELTEGKVTKGLSGTMTADEAIRALLDNTDLSYVFTDGKTIAIRQSAGPSKPMAPPCLVGIRAAGYDPEASGGHSHGDTLRAAACGNSRSCHGHHP